METDTQTGPRKARRTANACVACRQSKIKCSGEDPCQNCTRRAVRCHFAEGATKVMVSEQYLQDLQKKAQENRRRPSSASNGDTMNQQQGGYHFRSPVGPQSVASAPGPSSGHQNRSPSTALSHNEQRRTSNVTQVYRTGRPGGVYRHHSDDGVGLQRDARSNGVSSDTGMRTGPDSALVSPATTTDASQQRPDTAPSAGCVSGSAPPYRDPPSPLSVWSSPFEIPSMVIQRPNRDNRTWTWLSPWATWSFTIRLMLMMREKLHPEDPSVPPHLINPPAYSLTWSTSSATDLPDLTGLPSLNHAIYLMNTVAFHLGQTYRLFDEQEFEQQIRAFYANALQRMIDSRLWLAKFLLILAFGTAFHAPPTDGPTPPGAKFFVRAMSLVPDAASLWGEGLLAAEVLALASLYLYSTDQRESASLFLSQAIRVAQLSGFHTRLPESDLEPDILNSCRDLWWTLYIMDRHFSSALGLPMSVQAIDISTPVNPPNVGTPRDSTRSLQVNLAHLLSVILTTVYKPVKTPLAIFLEQTRQILHTMAHHAQEIERIISLKFQDSVGSMPQATRYVMLLYHQCVIVATRPLLLSVLKERLAMLGHPRDENWDSFLSQTGTVISTGIKSAAKTLQILTTEHSILEAFLPYDVEFTFGAALHLTMANALFPGVIDYQSFLSSAYEVLGDLISRGNRVARARRSELCNVEMMCRELDSQAQEQGHQRLHLTSADGTAPDLLGRPYEDALRMMGAAGMGAGSGESVDMNDAGSEMMNNTDLLGGLGISSEEFMSIVQQIGDPNSLPEDMLTLS